MDANKAISRIKFMLDVGGSDGFTSAEKEALNMAINALSAESSAPPKTNADRIRQMTDEEFAEFIDIYDIEDICRTRCAKTGEARERCMCYGEECKGNIMQWLKQEVSEDETD